MQFETEEKTDGEASRTGVEFIIQGALVIRQEKYYKF